MAYIGGVAIVLRKLQKIDITIEADGTEIGSGQYLLAGVANGRFSGGGFDGMPVALVDDGFMDLLLVKSISRTFFLSIVKKYHDGTHLGDPKLNGILYNYKCKEAIFRPKEKMILAIDGETAIVGAIKFNVMAGAVNLSVPE
jgi:diacylglycerol kinase family enzyme